MGIFSDLKDPGFSPEGAQKKARNFRFSLLYPLRAWHKPALNGTKGDFFIYGLE